MCLIGMRFDEHPRFRLVLAANRDERHARPTRAAGFWPDQPAIVGGRDLRAGGTWLGLHRSGRLAAVVNIRQRPASAADAPSRGSLVTGFLLSRSAALPWCKALGTTTAGMAGFHLLAFDGRQLVRFSQDEGSAISLPAGCHALSNHRSDEAPWPKCEDMQQTLAEIGEDPDGVIENLLQALERDRRRELTEPDTASISKRIFIRHPEYGTRSATVVLVDHHGRVVFHERRFDAGARATGESRERFRLQS